MTSEQGAQADIHYGTTQQQRKRSALAPEYVSVDERSLSDLLAYAASYAAEIKYVDARGTVTDPASSSHYTWKNLFEQDISVVLAIVIAYEPGEIDDKVQQAFLDMHRISEEAELVDLFTGLIGNLLELSEKLAGWKALKHRLNRWEADYRIVAEIDAAMRAELGHELSAFLTTVEDLLTRADFETHPVWEKRGERPAVYQQRVEKLRQMLNPAEHPDGPPDSETSEDDSLSPYLLRLGPGLQQVYRRLYFTVAYLQEIAENEFRESIEDRNDHEPHIALFIAFLRLFVYAQDELNQYSRRHLDYYYERILRRRVKGTEPDRTTVAFQLTPGAGTTRIPAGTRLLAGHTATGDPVYYRTATALAVSEARVARLKTLYVAHNPTVTTGGTYQLVTAVYSAAVADSGDGRGGPFARADKSWPLVGEDQFDLGPADRRMQEAEMGFAIAASLLQLAEGERKLRVELHCRPDSFRFLRTLVEDIADRSETGRTQEDVFHEVLGRAFRLRLPTPGAWLVIERYRISPLGAGAAGICIEFVLPHHLPPVVGIDPKVHGAVYRTDFPVLECTLRSANGVYPFSFLRELLLEKITLSVTVAGLRTVAARNDLGLVDASAPFPPFGPQPRSGSYLLVGHPELTNRQLLSVDFHLDWASLPQRPRGFADHYAEYPGDTDNNSFTVAISALSDYEFRPPADADEARLFTDDSTSANGIAPRTTLSLTGENLEKLALRPNYALRELVPYSNVVRAGYFRFVLRKPAMAFGHEIYPRLFAERLSLQARPRPFSLLPPSNYASAAMPEVPHTPLLNRVRIDYSAIETMDLGEDTATSGATPTGSRFFTIHPFGTEVVYAGKSRESTSLLPRFHADGYLLIGIENLVPPESLSLFFDLSVGQLSSTEGRVEINWQFWSGDGWTDFGQEQVISDSTVDLSTSGIVVLYCKENVRKGHPLHGTDCYWLRIAVRGDVRILGRCRGITPHAVPALWEVSDDPLHLATPPLARPRITDLAYRIAGIDSVRQLTAFTGGKEPEGREAFYIRGSERLRHKNRAVTGWDVEHLVLGKFPYLHQVKCVGPADVDGQVKAGELVVVCVPELTGETLTPRLGHPQLTDITNYLRNRLSPFVSLRVINPTYERVKINCRVRLKEGAERERGRIWKELHLGLRDLICPWFTGGVLPIGGTVNKNDVMALIGRHPEVTYVTGFSIVHIYQEAGAYGMTDTAHDGYTLDAVHAYRPWSLLVPTEEHAIDFLDVDEYEHPQPTAIERMRLETDFIISEDPMEDEPEPPTPAVPRGNAAILAHWLSS
ncbi:hypothetical protein CLV84_1032 [Neolewinella xylanilytica]|uniref:Baseplate J-like protein n=1 Tax=Neolewinella xylanilytica TaxID=1514080 RepID=A0A2S6I9C2_9BACT|nr:hypothetical protein [Neolewinella xylanilytica]PPK88069.1 hypothetical protein CLV84_1032 [Neolewinella xylanilytica]